MKIRQLSPHKGLSYEIETEIGTGLIALVGRNGEGKTRLLKGISEGKLGIFIDDDPGKAQSVQYVAVQQLVPNLVFSSNQLERKDRARLAAASYEAMRNEIGEDRVQALDTLAKKRNNINQSPRAPSMESVVYSAINAAEASGKPVNGLEQQEIIDFYSVNATASLFGSIDIPEIMIRYMDLRERNEFNEWRQERKGSQIPYWEPKLFLRRFGFPPWETINATLAILFGDKYSIAPPKNADDITYKASISRAVGVTVSVEDFSSGERVLLWLAVCMYAAQTSTLKIGPKVLLLDEPDASLHPQMIPKFFEVLEQIRSNFGCQIIFSTHSPTTIALSGQIPIWRVTERALTKVDKDAAIAELLVGVNQIAVLYTHRRQVYVESRYDAEIYEELHDISKRSGRLANPHISLSFIPAAPKLADSTAVKLIASAGINQEAGDKLRQVLEGEGDCDRVIGTVQSLLKEGNKTVHGIIDWDLKNKTESHVHVLGAGFFYTTENAILNPLTLGLFLLQSHPEELPIKDCGVPESIAPSSLIGESQYWQSISDLVTRRVLKVSTVNHDIQIAFADGASVMVDKRYSHQNGHDLEKLVKEAFGSLKRYKNNTDLRLSICQLSIRFGHGKTMPTAFLNLFDDLSKL